MFVWVFVWDAVTDTSCCSKYIVRQSCTSFCRFVDGEQDEEGLATEAMISRRVRMAAKPNAAAGMLRVGGFGL